jgi:SAM-dependent methyltransferase
MNYKILTHHYENCLEKHGDSHLGVDWPNALDASVRYNVMMQLVRHGEQDFSILDFGCGAGHFLEHLRSSQWGNCRYVGTDLSERFIDLCKKKFPEEEFFQIDAMKDNFHAEYDYIIANGVFTEKRDLSFDEMFDFFSILITKLFSACRRGIAFNVMSAQVEWQRDDLFHLPLDRLASFLVGNLARHFVIRNDYGLYEYTVYLYKNPSYATSYAKRQ